MKILGFDSSGLVASVALVEDEQLIAEYTVNYKKTHSQTLLPMLDEIVKMTELDLSSVDAIAVACGPGSFTGLRIGAATAKGLGLALNKPLVPVSTLQALAYNLWGQEGFLCPIMDARRKQVYTGVYRYDKGELLTVRQEEAMAVEDLINCLNALGGKVTFLGDGVPVYQDLIQEKLAVDYRFAPAHLGRQHGGSVASLGAALYAKGIFEAASEHKPEYLRLSQAERELKKKEESSL